MAKLDQGKVYEWSVSNHFIRTGAHTRFCDWRFVFRARLDCVALNGARRWGANKDKQCLYPNEKLPHVLNGCMKHSNAIQRRHNAICNRLETAITNKGVVRKDHAVPGCEFRRTLRPDIAWIDEAAKTMKIADVVVTFENRYKSLEKIRAEKIRKYAPIADEFRCKGWIVSLDAIAAGSLGGWDPANEATLRMPVVPAPDGETNCLRHH